MGKGTNIYRVSSVSDGGNSFIFGLLQALFSFISSEMYYINSHSPHPPHFLTWVEKGWREILSWGQEDI